MLQQRIALSLACACAVIGCVGGSRPVTRDDASTPGPIDAGAPDAGLPVCVGTPVACADRGASSCLAGCRVRNCRGTPTACSYELFREDCIVRPGCSWGRRDLPYDECFGDAYPCSSFTDMPACTLNGCEWYSDEPCEGSPSPCTSLDEAECRQVPGCMLADARDAGMIEDAGTPDLDASGDAGVADAGAAWCTVEGGECDPFAADPCGSGRRCVADATTGTRCVEARGEIGEGLPCTTVGECASGLECRGTDGVFWCHRQCPAGSTGYCGGGRVLCGQRSPDPSGCLRFCIDEGPPCDIHRQDCADGLACYPVGNPEGEGWIPVCRSPGTGEVGSSCDDGAGCVPGVACVAGVCRQLCETTADCATGACGGTAPLTYCL